MSVEGRIVMSIMIVEAGARGVVIAPDQKVLDYLEGTPARAEGRDVGPRRQEPGCSFAAIPTPASTGR